MPGATSTLYLNDESQELPLEAPETIYTGIEGDSATVWIELRVDGDLEAPDAAPKITIYDTDGATKLIDDQDMTLSAVGIYYYSYTIPADKTGRLRFYVKFTEGGVTDRRYGYIFACTMIIYDLLAEFRSDLYEMTEYMMDSFTVHRVYDRIKRKVDNGASEDATAEELNDAYSLGTAHSLYLIYLMRSVRRGQQPLYADYEHLNRLKELFDEAVDVVKSSKTGPGLLSTGTNIPSIMNDSDRLRSFSQ